MLSRRFVAVCVVIAGCSSSTTTGPATTSPSYAAQMEAACATTDEALAGLDDPADAGAVAALATDAARILRDEADAVRDLDPPDELADDHRAFVANTDEQADIWSEIAEAAAADPDRIGELRTAAAQLTLGRNDLSEAMGLPDCRRGDN